MPKPMPKSKVEKVGDLILSLLREAKKKAGPKRRIPVNDPDYAEAYGAHRGFLLAFYGNYSQEMAVVLPDGTETTAQGWFRTFRDQADPASPNQT